MPVRHKDGDYVNVHKTEGMMTHGKGKVQNDDRVQFKSLGIHLQVGQEVQVNQSLPLVQFDPEQDKWKQCLISNHSWLTAIFSMFSKSPKEVFLLEVEICCGNCQKFIML